MIFPILKVYVLIIIMQQIVYFVLIMSLQKFITVCTWRLGEGLKTHRNEADL
jgi:hypothetical protein